MRIAIRPPEYFPNAAYLALLMHVDHFVLADTFQYSHKSLHNRARLRNPQGWQWVTVPLRGTQHHRAIREVEISDRRKWPRSHWRAFMYNYRSTMYFEFFEDDLAPIFEKRWERLGPLTCATTELLAEFLELETTLVRASDLDDAPDDVPGVLAALGTGDDAELIAPLDAARHDAAFAPVVRAFHFEGERYRQNFEGFEPEMTAADLIFNYGPEARSHLRQGARLEAVTPPPAS
jgi:hypothetical protein